MATAPVPWDTEGRYIPDIHLGTRDEIVAGLIREAVGINDDGMMRLRAKGRELQRISEELRKHGADLLLGTDEDEGYILFIDRHKDGCSAPDVAKCHCPAMRRIRSCL